jgi:hypothetical protein
MPLGQGYLPAGALGTQLTYITRRAILDKGVVQIYNSSPLICGLLANAALEAGGVDSFLANVQLQGFVLPQWTGFQGAFNAATNVQGLQQAAWSMCWAVVPIPIFGSEILIQDKQKIQDILELRLTDAGNAMRDLLAQALYNNGVTATLNVLQIIGINGAIDDGTNLNVYAGINRTTFTDWKAKHYAMGSVNPTRALLMQNLTGVAKAQGEMPDFMITSPGTWVLAAQDFVGQERYWPNADRTDEYLSGFRALEVQGVPLYMDPYCPDGTVYAINTNYLVMRVHEEAQWEVIDFVPLTPVNQIGFLGLVFIVLALTLTKPKSCGRFDGYNFVTI